jgi:hypothetical protein
MSRGAPDAQITNACGYVFGSDAKGVYVVQLDGFHGMLRVKMRYDPEMAFHLQKCSALNPIPVSVDVRVYDIREKLFHGCLNKTGVGVNGIDIKITPGVVGTTTSIGTHTKSSSMGIPGDETRTTASIGTHTKSSSMGIPGDETKKTRKLSPMVY